MFVVAAVIGLLCLVASGQPLPNVSNASWWGPGDWLRPNVTGLEDAPAAYQENHTLYGLRSRHISTSSSSASLWSALALATVGTAESTVLEDRGYEPITEVLRNPNASGWAYLRVAALPLSNATSNATIEASYYAAGYAEGHLMMRDIYSWWYNLVEPYQAVIEHPSPTPAAFAGNGVVNQTCFSEFMLANIAFARNYTGDGNTARQVRRVVRQMEGLVDGWNAAYDAASRPSDMPKRLSFVSIYLINYQAELASAVHRCQHIFVSPEGLDNRSPPNQTRCSALVKISHGDLLVSHTTWFEYQSMIRMYKSYSHLDAADNTTQTMRISSYPGMVASMDDWYINGAGLAVTETTNLDSNRTGRLEMRPDRLATFVRATVASLLATTPAQWNELFRVDNSGGYNNQWMILQMRWAHEDLPHRELRPGTFWVVEQAPGMFVAKDQTAHLNEHSYWTSFNVPYYPAIRRQLNFTFTAPRGKMFDRMQGNVSDLTSIYYLIRYNNYKHDQLSTNQTCITPWTANGTVHCDPSRLQEPWMAIAARFDLFWGEYLALNGATDIKATSARMLMEHNFRTLIQLGPTAVQQPPFVFSDWSKLHPQEAKATRWRGLADAFTFVPTYVDDNATVVAAPPMPASFLGTSAGWVAGLVVLVVALSFAAAAAVWLRSHGDKRHAQKQARARTEGTPLV